MIQITPKQDSDGKPFFEATIDGSILEWDYSLQTLLEKLSLMTDHFETDLINNI